MFFHWLHVVLVCLHRMQITSADKGYWFVCYKIRRNIWQGFINKWIQIKMRIHMLLFKMLSEFPKKIQYNHVHNHIDRNIEWNISRNNFISVIKKMKIFN